MSDTVEYLITGAGGGIGSVSRSVEQFVTAHREMFSTNP